MKYQILELDALEYEEFNQKIPTYSLFQTYNFTKSRKYNYDDVKIVGLYEEGVLKATTQILIEKIPYIGKKMGTSIKGINIDFRDQYLLQEFQIHMQKYLKENNFLIFRFDLPIAYKLKNRDFQELGGNEKITFPVDEKIKEKLKRAGFSEFFVDENYMGRSPQYSMLVETSDPEKIISQFNRSVKRAIKTAEKYSLEVNRIEDPLAKNSFGKKYLEIFYDLHTKNAEQNQINVLPYQYYENLFTASKDLSLFLVKINCQKFLATSKIELEKKPNLRITKLVEKVKTAVENKKEEIYIVGHISGFYNKIGHDLFTGLDYTFKDLGSKEMLMKYIFDYSNQNSIEYYDFWGILGRLDENSPMLPIYNFKKKFSNIIVQYPGFWDIYTNKFLYKLFVKYTKIKYLRKNKK